MGREHSVVREGLAVGLLGAVLVAMWYFVVDAMAGRPLHTPNVLGRVFFRGEVGPGAPAIASGAVAGFTIMHLVAFALLGMGLTHLVHLASRTPALRMGLWIGLVVAFCFSTGLVYMLSVAAGERFPLWTVIGGSLVAVMAMGWMLIRRHPRIATEEAPLGSEVRSPPHAPGAPGRAPRR
jgi:hypothetical protein